MKLVLTSGWSMKTSYATLSHCWGGLEFLTLTRNSLASFMTKVPIEECPKTFQDAVFITRKLGIDYLWIDSLCIIQDSEQDWLNESALMSQVYSNSTITIAAAAACDGTIGCLVQLPNNLGRSCTMDIARYGLKTRNGRQTRCIFVPYRLFHNSLENSLLARRAWALQGGLLFPIFLIVCSKCPVSHIYQAAHANFIACRKITFPSRAAFHYYRAFLGMQG